MPAAQLRAAAMAELLLGMVCGSNKVIYDNKCAAFSVGVSLDYTGECTQWI